MTIEVGDIYEERAKTSVWYYRQNDMYVIFGTGWTLTFYYNRRDDFWFCPTNSVQGKTPEEAIAPFIPRVLEKVY